MRPDLGAENLVQGVISLPIRKLTVTRGRASRILDKELVRLPRGNLPASIQLNNARRYTPVSDELTPDPLAELLANPDANQAVSAPLVPAAPQFASRREIRNAADKTVTKASGKAAAKASTRKIASGKSAATIKPTPAYTVPKSQRVRLSMKDRALARRLAVTPRAAATAPRRSGAKAKQNPLKMMFVLLVISGFVGGIALPAAALGANNGGQAQSYQTTAEGKQAFKSTATIEIPAVRRDEITATSEAELKAEQVSSTTLASNLASYPGQRQPGDDYPWPTAGNTLSPLGYYYRQCVDFVAWRLNRDAGVTSAPWKWTWSNLTPNGGDASQWKAAWEAHGWKTSATPVVGSVAWFVGDHVAYVNAIKGSSVVIEEYNGSASRSYAMRTIPIDTVGRFLYPPP
jgi:peptidoglycan DL-endopeptidase CwlO